MMDRVREMIRTLEVSEYIREHVTKPVVGYVVGASAPPGKSMGHAGAIISGGGESGGCGWEDEEDNLSKYVFQDLIDLRFPLQKSIILGSLISFPITSACS